MTGERPHGLARTNTYSPPSALFFSPAIKRKKSFFPSSCFFTLFFPLLFPTGIMESTRVFVSGLPPTFSNDQLRKHFATRFQVTDAHVLPKRRIGFVGFKSHDDARQAVGYFNKTYMKMSKISVDIAKPVCLLFCPLPSSLFAPVPR